MKATKEIPEREAPYRVLLVDDEPGQRYLQREILSSSAFEVHESGDGRSALRLVEETEFDVVILDKRMPGLDGDEVCRRIREKLRLRLLPIIMISGAAGSEELVLSLEAGATDFLRKPFSPAELIARVTVAANHKRLLDQLEHVESLYFAVARMVEARDWHTGQHCTRLAHNSALFGRFLGLGTDACRLLHNLGTLHDIGKIAIPDRILLKEGALSRAEERIMEQHTLIGADLCSGIRSLKPLVPLIRHHHERWDGSGYPDGRAGEEIPYLSRIFQLLDIYDALASDRPYKRALPHDEILAHLEDERRAGRLDPGLTERFFDFLHHHGAELMLPAGEPAMPDDFSIIKSFYGEESVGPEAAPPPAGGEAADGDLGGHTGTVWPALPGHHSSILEATAIAVLALDHDGRITYANPACCRLLEYGQQELVGTLFHQAIRHTDIDGLEHPLARCPVRLCLVTGRPVEDEALFFTRRGKEIPVELYCSPLGTGRRDRRGIVVAFHDISEKQRMEARQRLAAAVFDSTHEGVMVTDARGRIVEVNDAFTRITGYAKNEVLGKTPAILRSEQHDADFYREMWKTIEETGRWQGEVIDRTRDGEIFPAWLTINNVQNNRGEITNYVGIFSDITSLKRSQEQIVHLAHHDPLTGLPNRLLLQDRLKVAVRHARRDGHSVAIMFLDLDRFKDINDSMGHLVGDQLLLEIAERIRTHVRAEDTVARIGGDEFVVLITSVKNQQQVELIAQKILARLEEPIELGDRRLTLSASMGISLFPQDSENEEELIRHADSAMYHAKEEGFSEYRFYDRAMSARAEQRLAMQAAMREALETGQFSLLFQPQVDLNDGRLVGVEALLRWNPPDRDPVPPDEFIPFAENSGFIEPLGEWVLRQACLQAASWCHQGLLEGRMAVNVSSVQVHRGRLLEAVQRALRESGLEPRCLELEITESTLMPHGGRGLSVLEELRRMGVRIAVDDFGTGYSSLSYLQRLPIDTLKIDRAFVQRLPRDTRNAAIARAIIALGQGLGLEVVAEGVETEEQHRFLTASGCRRGQGWLFSPPLPAMELAKRYPGSDHRGGLQ